MLRGIILIAVAIIGLLGFFAVSTADAQAHRYYTVEEGDTLQGIAEKFGVEPSRWTEMFASNEQLIRGGANARGFTGEPQGDWIFPKQVLLVPESWPPAVPVVGPANSAVQPPTTVTTVAESGGNDNARWGAPWWVFALAGGYTTILLVAWILTQRDRYLADREDAISQRSFRVEVSGGVQVHTYVPTTPSTNGVNHEEKVRP